MVIDYDQYDFVKWTKTRRRRVIDVNEMVKHNALLARFVAKKDKAKRK